MVTICLILSSKCFIWFLSYLYDFQINSRKAQVHQAFSIGHILLGYICTSMFVYRMGGRISLIEGNAKSLRL